MDYSTIIILFLVSLILILFSAFFSAAEIAYSSVSQSKIETEFKNKKRSAILIKKHYSKFGWTMATILILNNLVNVAVSVLASYLFSQVINSNGNASTLSTIVTTLVMTPIIVIFGEIIPKLLAKKYSFGYLSKIAYIIEILNLFFYPITYPLSKFALSSKVTNTETEIKTIIDLANHEGVLEKKEATLAKNALDLDSKYVYKIMTKTKDIKTIEMDNTISNALKIFSKTGYSRLPVTKNGVYKGVILLKDVFKHPHKKINDFIIKVPYVSKNSLTIKALELMRKEKIQIAFVVPNMKSKKTLGIITVEDILEEVIGEIYDEHDIDMSIREIALHKFLAIGSAKMSELEKITKTNFQNSNDMTIKQWLQSRIKRKMKNNLIYVYNNKYKFKIISHKNFLETKIEITQK